jgi:hypothetical protein
MRSTQNLVTEKSAGTAVAPEAAVSPAESGAETLIVSPGSICSAESRILSISTPLVTRFLSYSLAPCARLQPIH